MTKISRRWFGSGVVAMAASSVTSWPRLGTKAAAAPVVNKILGHVVIIGGGVGGATVAHHVRRREPAIKITLIEPKKAYTTCFFSNHYLGGFRTIEGITHSYIGLSRLGVQQIHQRATGVDPAARKVTLEDGKQLSYDRLVLAPGIDLKWGSVKGYTEEVAHLMPHAWTNGADASVLKELLEDLPDDGTVIIAAPPVPYRCPPAPYERASMIAHFLKKNKPKAKLTIYDTKEDFAKQALFKQGWNTFYRDIVTWVGPKSSGGGIVRVDPENKTLWTGNGLELNPDIANIIPAQKAGKIAHLAGCTEGDWCPIDPSSFMSKKHDKIYILGDSANAAEMPKSAFAANHQGRVVANQIIADLGQHRRFPARYRSACWSLIATNNAIKEGASYKAGKTAIDVTTKFISSVDDTSAIRIQNMNEAAGWYAGVTADIFAKG